MNEFKIHIFDNTGTLKAVITDFLGLVYVKRVNHPGKVIVPLAGNNPILKQLDDQWQIEIWRKNTAGTWIREITSIYNYIHWSQSGPSVGTIRADGLLGILQDRIIAWTAGYADRSKFTSEKAETIANTLVKYNATSSATTGAGRLRDGQITGLTVESDGAEGNTVDWFCAYDELLKSLQGLAKIGGGDFDIVKTSNTAWQWRWYTGQLGTDKSSLITFALGRNNMAYPIYEDDRSEEKTVAIVGGQGEGTDRLIKIRTGENYDIAKNNKEIFVPATDITTEAGLESRGDKALKEKEAVKLFNFKVLQIPGCQYSDDYNVGDKVKAINAFTGNSYTVKIEAATVNVKKDGSVDILVDMSEPL